MLSTLLRRALKPRRVDLRVTLPPRDAISPVRAGIVTSLALAVAIDFATPPGPGGDGATMCSYLDSERLRLVDWADMHLAMRMQVDSMWARVHPMVSRVSKTFLW
ncbi:hypothetical protein PG999_007907 [Apiospora kogelbergensis]|uniref:Uncharacterized protein n=1 Tax=Apiospora kogelbergensis TaxID=1337665 RepID=A0AAW0QMZ9_9PEZI